MPLNSNDNGFMLSVFLLFFLIVYAGQILAIIILVGIREVPTRKEAIALFIPWPFWVIRLIFKAIRIIIEGFKELK